ncbi:MAG: hypothetical protein Q8859_09315, partial [Bacteroidota bacterium]|nr:hypothetical protein [Bacteroidota bacterium]
KQVADIPVADCASMIRKYIVKGKMMKEDFAFEVKGTTEGGTIVTKDDGRDIRVFRRKSDYGNVVDAGPVSLYVQSYAISTTIMIASANIEPTNGVVHSLSYTHMFGDF